MNASRRVRRRQLLREVEGYLDLIMLPSAEPAVSDLNGGQNARNRLAMRSLEILRELDREGGTWRQSHLLYLMGQTYRVMHRYAEAIGPLEEAAHIAPSDAHIRLALAWCYKRVKRLDRAIETLEAALQVEPDSAIVHYNLACYWSLARNTHLATRYIASALDLDGNYRDLIADEPDFDPIRNDPDFQQAISIAV